MRVPTAIVRSTQRGVRFTRTSDVSREAMEVLIKACVAGAAGVSRASARNELAHPCACSYRPAAPLREFDGATGSALCQWAGAASLGAGPKRDIIQAVRLENTHDGDVSLE